MRVMAVGLAVAVLVAPVTAWAQDRWDWSGFPGEEQRSVIGCGDAATDEDWVCLALRCEADRSLALYAELSDFEIPGRSVLRIGDADFVVEGTQKRGDAPYTTRLLGDIDAIAEAMKAANQVVINREKMAITAGFETIHLRGSSGSIAALQQSCVADAKATAKAGQLALPLRHGIYVRAATACEGAPAADILSYWGKELNAQRVVGKITAVSGSAPDYVVTLDATDIAENESLGQFEWPMRIEGDAAFTLTDASPGDAYRWCYPTMP